MMRYDAGRAGPYSHHCLLAIHTEHIRKRKQNIFFDVCRFFFSFSPPLSLGVNEALDILALFTVY